MIKFILIVMALVVAGYIGHMYAEHGKPTCPTEDSCFVDYKNGEWHITEDR